MNMCIKVVSGVWLALFLMLAAGDVKAEIHSATFEKLSAASGRLGDLEAAGADARLAFMYSGSASAAESRVVYAVDAVPVPAAIEKNTLKLPAYSDLRAAAGGAEEVKADEEVEEEVWKPVPIADTVEAEVESKDTAGAVCGWLTVFLLLMLLLL